MNSFIKILLPAMILSFIFVSCGNAPDKNKEVKKDSVAVQIKVPVFNEDSAYHFVKQQTDFGARVNNTAAHDKCGKWLTEKMKTYSKDVMVQKAQVVAYNGSVLKISNIITSFNPDAAYRILLCSHWDSRPYADWDEDPTKHRTPIDGANDGASGVGVLIETARILQANRINIGVDILFLDAEDYGEPKDDTEHQKDENWGLGTQYWAKNPHKPNYKANFGILLDMVGVKDAQFTREGISVEKAPDVLNKVWHAAARIGYGGTFVNQQTNPINDDHYFINNMANIPTIDIIHHDDNTNTGFFKYWHTTKDNIDNIDRKSLKAVGQTLLTVIFEESGKIK
jgi:glutaminyl-peptide cyclotransferase